MSNDQSFLNEEGTDQLRFESDKDRLVKIPLDNQSVLSENNSLDWVPEKELKNYTPTNEISVFDVADFILKKLGAMTTMKLQKLVYYCQAWSLVWDEKPMFKEEIEAWTNGPVVRELFYFHRGQYEISNISIGNQDLLNEEQRKTIDSVLEFYGDKPSQWLIDLTHLESPWINARKSSAGLSRGNSKISLDSIANYYSSL